MAPTALGMIGATVMPFTRGRRHPLAGNTPPNVPTVLTNLWGSYRSTGGVPVEIGGAVLGHTDPSFFYANTLMLRAPRTYSVMLQTRFQTPDQARLGRVPRVRHRRTRRCPAVPAGVSSVERLPPAFIGVGGMDRAAPPRTARCRPLARVPG